MKKRAREMESHSGKQSLSSASCRRKSARNQVVLCEGELNTGVLGKEAKGVAACVRVARKCIFGVSIVLFLATCTLLSGCV